jgi:hypothetical protein
MSVFGLGGDKTGKSKNISVLSPEQTEVMRGYNQNILPYLSGYGSRLERLSQPAYNYNQGAFNEFYRTNVETPMRQQFRDEILPGIRSKGTPWSSVRAKAETRAGENLMNTLAAQRSKIGLSFMDKAAQQANLAANREIQMSPENILAKLLGTPQRENVVSPPQIGLLGGLFGGSGPLGLF